MTKAIMNTANPYLEIKQLRKRQWSSKNWYLVSTGCDYFWAKKQQKPESSVNYIHSHINRM